MAASSSPAAASDESYDRIDAPSVLQSWFAVPDDFERFPSASIHAIRARQEVDFPEGLIIDRLLALLIPGPQTFKYPPDVDALVDAAAQILEEDEPTANTRVNAVFYYLLLDQAAALQASDPGHDSLDTNVAHDLSIRPQRFLKTSGLPKQYRDAIKGYFLLERGQYRAAVPLLAGADFQPLVQRALSPLSPAEPSAAERSQLLLSLCRLSKTSPNLALPAALLPRHEAALFALQSFVIATANVRGLHSAWSTARALTLSNETNTTSPEEQQCKQSLLRWTFGTPPRPSAISELLGMSLSPADQALLHDFVASSSNGLDPQCGTVALDTLLVRYINAGQYLSAARLADTVPVPLYGEVELGIEDTKRARLLRDGRRRLVEGARSILPNVQRTLLDIQDGLAKERGQVSSGKAPRGIDHPDDMAMSWEAVSLSAKVELDSITPRPLSATNALRRPPAAADAPRAASHVIDPVGSLLHAVVTSSPVSKGDHVDNTQSAGQRRRASGTSSADNSGANSRAITPLRAFSLQESKHRLGASGPSLKTPSRPTSVQEPRKLLISQSPFAAPPRGRRDSAGTGTPRRSAGASEYGTPRAAQRASPLASAQSGSQSAHGTRFLSSLRHQAHSPSPPADAAMENGDQEAEVERPRRRRADRQHKRLEGPREDPTSEAETVPGSFPASSQATSGKSQRPSKKQAAPAAHISAGTRPERKVRQRSNGIDTQLKEQKEEASQARGGQSSSPPPPRATRGGKCARELVCTYRRRKGRAR